MRNPFTFTARESEMIYTHEAALLRIAELRHQAAAERRARQSTGGRRGRRKREGAEKRSGKPPQDWSTAA